MLGEGGRQEQAGIGHQPVVVKDRCEYGRGGCVVASIGCSFSGVGFFVAKPLSQKHRSTFLPLQDTAPTPSFGGFGLSSDEVVTVVVTRVVKVVLSGADLSYPCGLRVRPSEEGPGRAGL